MTASQLAAKVQTIKDPVVRIVVNQPAATSCRRCGRQVPAGRLSRDGLCGACCTADLFPA